MTLDACGTLEHPEECLCDVVITETAPIIVGFDETWGADVVKRATGYKDGQGGAKLASYLEALAYAYDNTRDISQLCPEEEPLPIGGTADRKTLLARITELLKGGDSIVDLPDMLQVSFATITQTITGGNASIIWGWDETQWIRWESWLLSHDGDVPCGRTLMKKRFGIGERLGQTLVKTYGKEPRSAPAHRPRK